MGVNLSRIDPGDGDDDKGLGTKLPRYPLDIISVMVKAIPRL